LRFWVFSDIHADVNNGYRLPKQRPECDAVIIAGDMCEGAERAIKVIGAAKFGVPVIYVAGNHDFYRTSVTSEIERAREAAAKFDRVHFLERDRVILRKGTREVQVLGATLWTDYRLDGEADQWAAMERASAGLNDHKYIRNAGRRWRPKDALADHEQSAAWLKTMIDARKPCGTTVVVTHHAPSRRSIAPEYVRNALNSAYASNLDLLASRADLWVHGHIHAKSDYKIDDCRVIANPLGYTNWLGNESADFDPSLVIEV
jgi:predicted phosphodiesterase